MNKVLVILFFLILSVSHTWGQEDEFLIEEQAEDRYRLKDQLVLDMNLQLQFGSVNGVNYTLIGGTPQIGYRITPRFIMGAGYNYNLITASDPFGFRSNYTQTGPTVYGSFVVYDNYFIRSDYQWLTGRSLFNGSVLSEERFDVWLVGAGYRNYVSNRLAISGGIYLDINSPVIQPLFRTGIEYAFGGWD